MTEREALLAGYALDLAVVGCTFHFLATLAEWHWSRVPLNAISAAFWAPSIALCVMGLIESFRVNNS
jgi:hypothetical protein